MPIHQGTPPHKASAWSGRNGGQETPRAARQALTEPELKTDPEREHRGDSRTSVTVLAPREMVSTSWLILLSSWLKNSLISRT